MSECILPLLVLSLIGSVCHAKPRKTRIILDTDANNEVDDQHAIAYMLFNGDVFDVEGITVNRTRNGGDLEKHFQEAERVVKLCNLDGRVNIYRGADGNFDAIRNHLQESAFDGVDAVDFIIGRARAESARRLVLLPIGKLTNIALALEKAPDIVPRVRVVWLGGNYPGPGEYNLNDDPASVNAVIESGVEFEMVTVRYGASSGTAAVKARIDDIRRIMPGKGPRVAAAVTGRYGGEFHTFGDYSVDLFNHVNTDRALYDMAAVAIVKNAGWGQVRTIPAPRLDGNKWIDRPENPRTIKYWEIFDKEAIMADFYESMETVETITKE